MSMIAKYLGVNFVEMIVEVLVRIDTFSKRESINSWEKVKKTILWKADILGGKNWQEQSPKR